MGCVVTVHSLFFSFCEAAAATWPWLAIKNKDKQDKQNSSSD